MYELKVLDETHKLLFDMGTLEHLEEITKQDPFSFTSGGTEPWRVSGMARVIFLAGKRSYYDAYGKEYDFTAESVKGWTKRMSGKEAARLIKAYGEAYSDSEPEAVGEAVRVVHK